jgi:hypothetical protein
MFGWASALLKKVRLGSVKEIRAYVLRYTVGAIPLRWLPFFLLLSLDAIG